MGWYYDAAMTQPVSLTDKVNSDLMLYAKVVDTSNDISVVEGVYRKTLQNPSEHTYQRKPNSSEDHRGKIACKDHWRIQKHLSGGGM